MVMTLEEEKFAEAFINGTDKKYPFMAPIGCSVKPSANAKLFPFDDRHSGPRIFDTKKLRELIGDPDQLYFRWDSFYENKASSGSSLYEVATAVSAKLEGTGPVNNIAMATIEAEFVHKVTDETMTSFAKVSKKIGRGRFNGPNALGNQSEREMIRQLLLHDVKSEVDNIRSRDDAQNFVKRYGPAIIGTAQFGGAISVYTKTSMNKKENATSMSLSLSAELQDKKLNAAGGVSIGLIESTEDNSFRYNMSAYGGNISLLLDDNESNVMKRWTNSMDPEDDRHPMAIIDMSFLSISVLAEWESPAERYLESASTIEISLMEERLRKMFVEKPIGTNVRKNLLFVINNLTDFVNENKTMCQGKVDTWSERRKENYRNGILACDECLKLLKEFNALVIRPDRSGESTLKWAKDKLRNVIKTQFPKTWGFPSGSNSQTWNWIWENFAVYWEWGLEHHDSEFHLPSNRMLENPEFKSSAFK